MPSDAQPLSLRIALRRLGESGRNAALGRVRGVIQTARYEIARRRTRGAIRRPNCIAIVSGDARPTPPVAYGGVELSLYVMACDLRDRGWEVHLWGRFQPDPNLYQGLNLHEGIDPEGVEITALNPAVAYLAWPSAVQLTRLTRDPTRVVIGEYNHPTCLPPLVADSYVRCMNPLFAAEAEKAGYRRDRIITAWLWQRDETRYQPDIPREPWLLWVARPDRTKALEEAFRFAILTGEEVRFYAPWYPGAEEWAQVLERARPPNVTYMGEMARAQKADLYSRCRAFLYTAQPTYKEAFGLIFLEALTSGTPVVALDHHVGSTQSELFPGLPFGIRASNTEQLASLWLKHRDGLSPDAVARRCSEIYRPVALANDLDRRLRGLVLCRART